MHGLIGRFSAVTQRGPEGGAVVESCFPLEVLRARAPAVGGSRFDHAARPDRHAGNRRHEPTIFDVKAA